MTLIRMRNNSFNYNFNNTMISLFGLYKQMIQAGVAKECARDVLPLSTPTTLYMHGNLRSWLTYVDLRSGNGTQLEHKYIADSVKELIAVHFPQCYAGMWSDS